MTDLIYPYSKPTIHKDDIKAVVKALKTEFLTQGNSIKNFEDKLKKIFSVKYALACNSGTASLHMIYKSLGLDKNNGIITTPLTFIATANAARMCNAPIKFADVDPNTGNVSLNTIKDALKTVKFKVKLIVLVHLGGRPCDIKEIFDYTKKLGIKIVEDACHAPLAKYYDKKIGFCDVGSCKHSSAVALSLHPIKHFTAGEGGVILTNDKKIYECSKLLRSHSLIRDKSKFLNKKEKNNPWYYEINDLGYNYRLSEINSALALSQLKRLDSNIKKRENIAKTYNNILDGINGITIPKIIPENNGRHAWHLYSIKIDFNFFAKKRSQVMNHLFENGIGTQVHYIPLYRQKIYSNYFNRKDFLGAEEFYKSTLSLPIYETLKKKDIIKITNCLLSKLKN